ncbi:MAG: hypothetical protein JST65_05155 [Acidobacteria bacterium]|nr:hypothetical protein [Acidobacteriota bacterium]
MSESRFIPVPVHQRSKFEAADPWEPGNAVVTWKLLNYEFPGLGPDALCPGIATVSGTRYRILPLSLAPLLEERAVKPEQLPALLERVEKTLRLSDYPPRKTFGDSGLALMLVALLPLWLAWKIGFAERDQLFSQLVAGIGAAMFLRGLWFLAQGPLRLARERRLTARFRRLIAKMEPPK